MASRLTDELASDPIQDAMDVARMRDYAVAKDHAAASMTEYKPSLRDRAGALIAGDAKAGDVRYNLAHGIVGSAGVGGRGVGLADLTPASLAMVPGDVSQSVGRGDYVGAALNVAGAGGSLIPVAQALKAARPAEHSMASKSFSLYDPPVRPQRPFSDDYRRGVNAPEGSPLAFDMDGRPLTARYVAGRRTVGGDDHGLRPEDVVALIEAISGARPKSVAGTAIEGKAGKYTALHEDGDVVKRVFINKALTPENTARVIDHEAGHMIADHAGDVVDAPYMRRIGNPGPAEENGLARIYNDLNYPRDEWRWTSQEKPGGKPMRLTYAIGPKEQNYSPKDWPAEFQAEAIRAYLADPNYLKTTAPSVAKALRKYVNSHPRLKDMIQLNAVAPIGAAGLAASASGGAPERADGGRVDPVDRTMDPQAVSDYLASKASEAIRRSKKSGGRVKTTTMRNIMPAVKSGLSTDPVKAALTLTKR